MATDAGSRMHVLDWVERPRDEFLDSLNALLDPTGIKVGPNDHWRPLGRHDPSELRLSRPSDPLVPVDLARHLRSWWLAVDHPRANDPNWDLAASATFPGNRRGLVLIEAKAHVAELAHAATGKRKGTSAGSAANHESIGRAIAEAALALNRIMPGVKISRDSHYQFSNRVAFGWKLASMGIPAVVIYLGFTGDHGMAEQGEPLRDANHWRETVLDHTREILPKEFWEREISIQGTPLWLLIRARPCARQSAPIGQRPSLKIG